jgi:hypothetical protein
MVNSPGIVVYGEFANGDSLNGPRKGKDDCKPNLQSGKSHLSFASFHVRALFVVVGSLACWAYTVQFEPLSDDLVAG